MPGIDGVETLRRLRETNKDSKVIMVTGKKPDDEGVGDQCKELGIVDYIHKPLELGELERVVLANLK
jgi:two-component system response regulator (stage 0 sporulation protein F)